MLTRRALVALWFSFFLPLAVALVGGPPAAHATEVEGACGDRPCEEIEPDSGPCGDRPCEEIQQPGTGACGDRPCDEAEPPADPSTMGEPLPGTQDPAIGSGTDGAGAATGAESPAEPQATSDPDAPEDLEAVSGDEGSFPMTLVAIGIAVLLVGLALWMRSRRRRST